MVIGIDPSFSSTGVALYNSSYTTFKLENKGSCYSGMDILYAACSSVANSIIGRVTEETSVIIEYPALATPSGAYLAILNGYISAVIQSNALVKEVCWVPPNAVNSFTSNKAKSKTYLVNWCKDKGLISKRTSHDECTAIILVEIYKAIKQNKYKNKYFLWTREK